MILILYSFANGERFRFDIILCLRKPCPNGTIIPNFSFLIPN